MPDQTLVVRDSERVSIIIFVDRSIDSLLYADIHRQLNLFYQAATTAKCEEQACKLLGSLSSFLDGFTEKWRIYVFGNFMWPFIWHALTTLCLTDNTRSWEDKEDRGHRILFRLLYEVQFFAWKWTRSKFPLPHLVSSPRARQFLQFWGNYDPSDAKPSMDIGLNNAILYDVRAAKLRIHQEKGETTLSELVEAEQWQWQDTQRERAPRVVPRVQERNRVSQLDDEAGDDVNSLVQPIPSELLAQDKAPQGSPPPEYIPTSRINDKASNKGPPTIDTSKPPQVIQVSVPVPVATKVHQNLDDATLDNKCQKDTGFYPPPS